MITLVNEILKLDLKTAEISMFKEFKAYQFCHFN